VEEPWLGPDGEPGGFALRLTDGQRGVVQAGEVRLVDPDTEEVVLGDAAAIEAIEELAPPLPAAPAGVPVRAVLLLVACLALLTAVEITVAFSIAKAVTGHAY
jgi:hypothetical protein